VDKDRTLFDKMEVHTMFPIMVISIGVAVLVFGGRLAVLGAAVGALLGVVLLHLFPGSSNPLLELAIPILLAVLGFFGAGFAKGIVNIVILVMGALAGAAIVLGFLDLFRINLGLLDWLLAVVGGVVGLIMVRRYKDWAMIILAGLVGGLLVTRGLSIWLPFLQGALGTLLVLVLAGGGIALQGGFFTRRKEATHVQSATEGGSATP
jgi:hypothetical protein